MAQQVKIDIIADTKKLTDGVNNANNQLTGLSKGLSGVQQQAVGIASAFILREGVSFLKKANEEAIDAEKTAKAAAKAFGEGSTALQKITSDAEKFSNELAIDNDEIIKLATGLGIRLPKDAQGSSTELVLLAKNLEAASSGAIGAETTLSKLGKAFSDGQVTAKELSKAVPGLDDATYKLAETLSKAGKNQEAMNVLVEAGQKKFGGAAADQVTGSQRMEKAMGDLYEMIGKNVAPIVENKDVVIPLVTVLGGFAGVVLALNAGLAIFNGVMAAWKTATVIATGVQAAFNAVMALNPIALVVIAIVALIAIIVLLVKNWDTVTEVVGKVWEAIKDFAVKAFNTIKEFVTNVIEGFINFYKKLIELVVNFVSNIIEKWVELVTKIKDFVAGFVSSVVGKFSEFKNKITDFVGDIVDKIKEIPGKMFDIGVNIVKGLWNGINNMVDWLKGKFTSFFKNLVPDWAEKALGIASPSKVFSAIGQNVIKGFTTPLSSVKSISVPQMATATASSSPINITINAGLGTNGPALGREVSSAIKQYGKISSRSVYTGGFR